MYISLYRRYRPQKFADMVGQAAAVSVLQESLKGGHLGHAYLFSGPRGCGKTSAARLVAKSLNCLSPEENHEPCGECESCRAITLGEHLDVTEIDAASNRGIGEIRDLKSHVNLKPLSASYKVYIIDEVHMLTEAAFNALLKTLEEPPANVIFLLATTEPHKVPVTIRSRCQHIPFHRISIADMVKRLSFVCECEGINADQEAVWEISRQADGALRDALSLTEQATALGKGSLTLDNVRDLMGGSNRTELEKWIVNLHKDPGQAAMDLHVMLARGISIERFTESLFAIFRDLWIFLMWGKKGIEALEISATEYKFLEEESSNWNTDKLKAACMFCNRLLPRTRYGMRLEVFSGLVMLELIGIIEGKLPAQGIKPSAASWQPQAAPQAGPVVRQKIQAEKQPMVFDKEPEPRFTEIKTEIKKEISNTPAAPADNTALCGALGDNDFSRLIDRLGSKSLPIGAALLNCDIVSDGSSWDISFPCASPSESFLLIPQNRKILAAAILDVWNLKDVKSNNAESEEVKLPVISGVESPASPAAEQNKTSKAIIGSADRIVKLLGAEVLYVKDANFEDDPDGAL